MFSFLVAFYLLFAWLCSNAVGFLLSWLFFPSVTECRMASRLLISFVLTYVVFIINGSVLAKLTILNTQTTWMMYMAWCIITVFFLYRRKHLFSLKRPFNFRFSRKVLVPVALLSYTIATIFMKDTVDTHGPAFVSWYYLADAIELMRQGVVPEFNSEYGHFFSYETNKISWSFWSAQVMAMSSLLDRPSEALWVLKVISRLLCVFSAWVWLKSITRESFLSALLALLLMSDYFFQWKMDSLRGEVLGFILLFAALRYVREFSESEKWQHGLLIACIYFALATTHMVPLVIAVFWYAAVAISRLLLQQKLNISITHHFRTIFLALAATGLLWASVGRTPFGLQKSGMEKMDNDVSEIDYTHAFRGPLISGRIPEVKYRVEPEQSFSMSFAEVKKNFLSRMTSKLRTVGGSSLDFNYFGFLLIILILGVIFQSPTRDVFLSAIFVGILIFGFGMFFHWRASTMIMKTHVFRREFPYLILLLYAGLSASVNFISGTDKRAWRYRLVAIFLVATLLSITDVRKYSLPALSQHGQQAYAWLRKNAGIDARILPSGHSDGIFRAMTSSSSVLEGRAPYFQRDNLVKACKQLKGAIEYFSSDESSTQFLTEQRVQYVIVGAGINMGLRGWSIKRKKHPGMELASSFGPIKIYKKIGETLKLEEPY
jgi:hypothetical protein